MKSHKTNSLAQKPNISHKNQEPQPITHNKEKISLVLSLAGGFQYGIFFNKKDKTHVRVLH